MKIHFNHKEELWNSWSHAGGIAMAAVVGTSANAKVNRQ